MDWNKPNVQVKLCRLCWMHSNGETQSSGHSMLLSWQNFKYWWMDGEANACIFRRRWWYSHPILFQIHRFASNHDIFLLSRCSTYQTLHTVSLLAVFSLYIYLAMNRFKPYNNYLHNFICITNTKIDYHIIYNIMRFLN